jgi:hypothetical protein
MTVDVFAIGYCQLAWWIPLVNTIGACAVYGSLHYPEEHNKSMGYVTLLIQGDQRMSFMMVVGNLSSGWALLKGVIRSAGA